VDYNGRDGYAVPDLDDGVVLDRHLDFVKRLGACYDGHPDIDHIDLGTVGWWGEWHMSSSKAGRMPTMENRKKVIDAYVRAFPKTRLVMLIGDPECLGYAAKHGAGWRADCLGDMGGFSKGWCHMRNAYPQLIRDSGVQEAWRAAPVAWETCWDMRRWVNDEWPLRYIFNYALALHGSYFNNKSAPLPEGDNVRNEVERFLRRLGYRLVLRELQHPGQAKAGDAIALRMKWQNVGSAPCYRPYRVAYRLTGDRGYRKIVIGGITVDRWMPGSVEVFTGAFLEQPPDLPGGETAEVVDPAMLPADFPAGRCQLAIGVVGEDTEAPILRIGIKGRSEDGWYPLSELMVLE